MQRDDITPGQDMWSADTHPVLVVCTGGTFDKIYDPIKENLVVGARPASQRILRNAKVPGVALVAVTHKDSLDLTKKEIDKICATIERAAESRIVVVHGTSRLTETAQSIPNRLAKTIVFTGAMVPASIDSSEASFNLGFALGAARTLSAGVWIAMNGQIFRPGHVVKNNQAGLFERL